MALEFEEKMSPRLVAAKSCVCVRYRIQCINVRLTWISLMLNAVNSVLADVSSVSPSSEQRAYPHQPQSLTLIHFTFYRHADQN